MEPYCLFNIFFSHTSLSFYFLLFLHPYHLTPFAKAYQLGFLFGREGDFNMTLKSPFRKVLIRDFFFINSIKLWKLVSSICAIIIFRSDDRWYNKGFFLHFCSGTEQLQPNQKRKSKSQKTIPKKIHGKFLEKGTIKRVSDKVKTNMIHVVTNLIKITLFIISELK